MSKMIYVVDLPASFTAGQVSALFSDFGVVDRVNLVTDRETGRSRGFGFVEMSSGADEAIRALDRRRVGAARLRVKAALPSCRAVLPRLPKRARQVGPALDFAPPLGPMPGQQAI